MANHRQRAEALLDDLDHCFYRNGDPPTGVHVQMAIAHALLALGDQIAHDWEEAPDA